jgi:hypothetical protein
MQRIHKSLLGEGFKVYAFSVVSPKTAEESNVI